MKSVSKFCILHSYLLHDRLPSGSNMQGSADVYSACGVVCDFFCK